MDIKKEVLALLVASIDLKKLSVGLLHLAEKEAQDLAAKSATPVDDAIEAVVFPAANPAVEKLINDAVDGLVAKILA